MKKKNTKHNTYDCPGHNDKLLPFSTALPNQLLAYKYIFNCLINIFQSLE